MVRRQKEHPLRGVGTGQGNPQEIKAAKCGGVEVTEDLPREGEHIKWKGNRSRTVALNPGPWDGTGTKST